MHQEHFLVDWTLIHLDGFLSVTMFVCSIILIYMKIYLNFYLKHERFPLKPSVSLHSQEANCWMAASKDSMELLNKTLQLIHPDLYHNGCFALDKLRNGPFTLELASSWTSVYTGVSIISNRITKPHRDRNGKNSWYDLLVTLGNYKEAVLKFEELGVEFAYNPGTVVGCCGNLFTHEVGDWGEGDRICYAFFMRKAVLARFMDRTAEWMTQDVYNLEREE
jgi:hypothetical protein